MTTSTTTTTNNTTTSHGSHLTQAVLKAVGKYSVDNLFHDPDNLYSRLDWEVRVVEEDDKRKKNKAKVVVKLLADTPLNKYDKDLLNKGIFHLNEEEIIHLDDLTISHSDFEYYFEKNIIREGVVVANTHEKGAEQVNTTKESLALGDGFLILENGSYRPWKEVTMADVSEATKALIDTVIKQRVKTYTPLLNAIKMMQEKIALGEDVQSIEPLYVKAPAIERVLSYRSVGVLVDQSLKDNFESKPGYRKLYFHSMMPKLAEPEHQPDLIYVAWSPGVFCYFNSKKARLGFKWAECFDFLDNTLTPTTSPLLTFAPAEEFWSKAKGREAIEEAIKDAESGNQCWRHNMECIIEDDLTREWFMNLLGAGIIGRPKRPRAFVSVNGAPNAGKSSLFEEILQPIFGEQTVTKVEKEAFFRVGNDEEKRKKLSVIGQAGAYFIDEADDKEMDSTFLKDFTGTEKIGIKVLFSNEGGRKKSGIPFFLSNGHLKWNKKMVGLPGRFVNIHFDNGKREMTSKGLKMFPLKDVNLRQLGMLKELYDGFRRVYELSDSAEIEDRTFQIEEILPEALNKAPGYDDILMDDPVQGFMNTLTNSGVITPEERSNKGDYVKFSALKTFLDVYRKENRVKLTDSEVRTWFKENVGDVTARKTMVVPGYVWGERFCVAHNGSARVPDLASIASEAYHSDWYGVMSLSDIAESAKQL